MGAEEGGFRQIKAGSRGWGTQVCLVLSPWLLQARGGSLGNFDGRLPYTSTFRALLGTRLRHFSWSIVP